MSVMGGWIFVWLGWTRKGERGEGSEGCEHTGKKEEEERDSRIGSAQWFIVAFI